VFYRPYLIETLHRLSNDWELIIFTASAPEYANRIIDIIDPDKSLFGYRLFRKDCYQSEKGLYIKDLRIFNRNIERTVIVDDAAYSYGFQPDNGIPIIPFKGDKEDSELLFLSEYLQYLVNKGGDYTKINRNFFRTELLSLNGSPDAIFRKMFSSKK